MRKKVIKKNNKYFMIGLLLVVSLLSISIGFSAMSTTLTINGTAYFEPVDMIRVLSIKENNSYNSLERSKSFTIDSINVLLDISENGYATYDVNITNLGQVDKVVDSIIPEIFSNNEMEYTIDGLKVGTLIKAKEEVNFKITFKYKDDVIPTDEGLNAKIKFKFSDYDNTLKTAYLLPYNGEQSFFGFNKNSIVSFSRNTTLTLDEVKAKEGVKIISNESDDDYNSLNLVYGYVEDNNFYWWSEADIVYFHPKTVKAFNRFSNIVTIDLNGLSTEKVENFAHFFDTSRKLKTINGIIDTSGLVLEYNPNFDYLNDHYNDSSGGTGLAYMFNDCNALVSVDLSHFNTTNAGDMKRMFGGCRSLKSIDVSNFDTSNVKSMYWMFRQNYALTELDVSSFDTSKVVNMFGMFVQSNNIKTITLGEKFDTSNVKYTENMFYENKSLTTIYAYSNFIRRDDSISTNMFYSANKLVGAANTSYETKFNSSIKDNTYAQIATVDKNGYFTSITEKE